jgi:uncharacterized protein
MIARDLSNELIFLSEQYPIVTVIGPRQSGKTTLAKSVFPMHSYQNLESPEIRSLAETDPRAFFSSFQLPVIIDEVQRVPSILSYIQAQSDEIDKNGQFILTGSYQLSLQESISQSLAGRTALATLYPLSILELQNQEVAYSRDETIFQGFYPRIYKEQMEPHRFYRNYYQTYIERDLRQMIQIRSLSLFDKFVRILAGRIGNILNTSSIAQDVGVSSSTIQEWISILEASFVIYRLPPYYNNFGKRLIKSPKIYFTDIGLACYLLGITQIHQVSRDPLIGNMFENMVVMDIRKTLMNQGLESNLFFYRDHNNHEVDLLIKYGDLLLPVEIKSAMSYHESLHKNIPYFQKISGIKNGLLLYAGNVEFQKENISVANYQHFSKVFSAFMQTNTL